MTGSGGWDWSTTPDDAHPVRWSSFGSDPDAWLPLDDAVARMAGYGADPELARADLLAGKTLQTAFASYTYEPAEASR